MNTFKIFLWTSVILLCFANIQAQSISRSVISFGGTEYYANSPFSLDATFGEIVIEEFNGPYLLTQGFQQGDLSDAAFPPSPEIEASVYPNPFDEMLEITIRLDADLEMRVYNILGQLVYSAIPETENMTIQTSDWGTGVYFINFSAGGKRLFVEKVIKHFTK